MTVSVLCLQPRHCDELRSMWLLAAMAACQATIATSDTAAITRETATAIRLLPSCPPHQTLLQMVCPFPCRRKICHRHVSFSSTCGMSGRKCYRHICMCKAPEVLSRNRVYMWCGQGPLTRTRVLPFGACHYLMACPRAASTPSASTII